MDGNRLLRIYKMNMEERLQAVVSQAENDGYLWHTIIHGNNTTTVSTENGMVPSVAKQLKDVRDELINGAADYLGSCLKAKNETTAIRDNALVIKSQIEELKTDTQEFRDTAENYKNMAQTTFNSISSAVSKGISNCKLFLEPSGKFDFQRDKALRNYTGQSPGGRL